MATVASSEAPMVSVVQKRLATPGYVKCRGRFQTDVVSLSYFCDYSDWYILVVRGGCRTDLVIKITPTQESRLIFKARYLYSYAFKARHVLAFLMDMYAEYRRRENPHYR